MAKAWAFLLTFTAVRTAKEQRKKNLLALGSHPHLTLTLARAPLARVPSFRRKIPYLCLQDSNRRPFTQEQERSEAGLERFFFSSI